MTQPTRRLFYNSPDENGDSLSRLKADPAIHALPVIFCSGQSYLADEVMEVGSGLIQLPDRLRNILSARPAGSNSA